MSSDDVFIFLATENVSLLSSTHTFNPQTVRHPPAFDEITFFPLLFIACEIKSNRDDVESFLNFFNATFLFFPLFNFNPKTPSLVFNFFFFICVKRCETVSMQFCQFFVCSFEWDKKNFRSSLEFGLKDIKFHRSSHTYDLIIAIEPPSFFNTFEFEHIYRDEK